MALDLAGITNLEFYSPHYLDAVLELPDSTLRFFFPDDENCREILRKEAWVEYVNLGTLGEVRRADLTCTPVGIASLEAWRSRRGRRQSPHRAPRGRPARACRRSPSRRRCRQR